MRRSAIAYAGVASKATFTIPCLGMCEKQDKWVTKLSIGGVEVPSVRAFLKVTRDEINEASTCQ